MAIAMNAIYVASTKVACIAVLNVIVISFHLIIE